MSLATSPKHEIAWAAGLFEGEGCLTITRGAASAALVTTDRDVLERFVAAVGLGYIETSSRKPRPSSFMKKEQWCWKASGHRNVQAIIAAFWDFLGARRKAKAAEILTRLAKTPLAPKYRALWVQRGECAAGHDVTGENLYVNPTSGRKFCKLCLKKKQQAYYLRTAGANVKSPRIWR